MRKKIPKNKGFSLPELLVVAAIFVILTAIVLFKNQQFNNTITLQNLAYEIALSIRQAQVFGLSVTEAPTGFDNAYGVAFIAGDGYVLFSDADGGLDYDSGEEVESFSLRKGNVITQVCARQVSGPWSCDSPSSSSPFSFLFQRPNPEAIITKSGVQNFFEGEVFIESPSGNQKKVFINSSGQISVID